MVHEVNNQDKNRDKEGKDVCQGWEWDYVVVQELEDGGLQR